MVLTGSQVEADMFNQAYDPATGDSCLGLSISWGRLSVRELMAVIAASHAVVSGATGPAHIAAACGVPNVSLFDPRRNNLPTRWQPLGKGSSCVRMCRLAKNVFMRPVLIGTVSIG